MIDALKLRAIVNSSQDDFMSLAAAAGGDPATFYRGANFNDTDLRGEDLRGFNLEAATFKRVRVDRNTLVDKEFSPFVGTERTLNIQMPLGNLLQNLLSSVEIKILRPTLNQYGDLVEEAIFGEFSKLYLTNKNKFSMPVDREVFLVLTNSVIFSQKKNDFLISASSLEEIMYNLVNSDNKFVYSHFLKYLSEDVKIASKRLSMRQAALTRRTAEAVRIMSRKEKIEIPALCCALLIAYASALQARR